MDYYYLTTIIKLLPLVPPKIYKIILHNHKFFHHENKQFGKIFIQTKKWWINLQISVSVHCTKWKVIRLDIVFHIQYMEKRDIESFSTRSFQYEMEKFI